MLRLLNNSVLTSEAKCFYSCFMRRKIHTHQPQQMARKVQVLSSKCCCETEGIPFISGNTLCTRDRYLFWESSRLSSPLLLPVRWKQTHSRTKHLGEIKSEEFFPLYLCNQIIFLRVFCRLAKYSALFFTFGLPASLAMMQLEMLSPGETVNVIAALAIYTIVFTAQSTLFASKVLGKVMISSDLEYVKLSHLSAFGDRRDIYVKPIDIVPIPESELFAKKLVSVRFENNPKRLFFLPQQGGSDTNYEALERLFIGDAKKK